MNAMEEDDIYELNEIPPEVLGSNTVLGKINKAQSDQREPKHDIHTRGKKPIQTLSVIYCNGKNVLCNDTCSTIMTDL